MVQISFHIFQLDVSKLSTFKTDRWLGDNGKVSVKADRKEASGTRPVESPKIEKKREVESPVAGTSHAIDKSRMVRTLLNKIPNARKRVDEKEKEKEKQKPLSVATPTKPASNEIPSTSAATSAAKTAQSAKPLSLNQPSKLANKTVPPVRNVLEEKG